MKTVKTAGADNLTPSKPQYFSWINNTNEGATEEQTLVNLDFFAWLKREYGMEIDIYAWDAGNFDGASKHYGAEETEKLKKQYPEGYKNVVEKAKSLGIRMGLWGSPDGFGDDEKTEKDRFEFFVHLCRDYNFGEFKLDGVCGRLRPEKASLFREMLIECRKYSPDLIVLNHRLEYYEANDYVTTDLFNGQETYVDILSRNENTAMHHRAFMFGRGHTDGLNRLMEDHGVCISSCIDYFEDELIYQAFGRCLILAPEIYGNPWFMKDSEFARLARIYNLHRRNAPILVNGMRLPDEMGNDAVTRGTDTKRFITTGNNSWNTKTITLTLDESIGITHKDKMRVNLHHPLEKAVGTYGYGDKVEIELMPFRAYLIEIAAEEEAEKMLDGCEYEIIKEAADGTPLYVRLYSGETTVPHENGVKEEAPRYLGTMEDCYKDGKEIAMLYNAAAFAPDNDALEAQSVKRSGKTEIPEVQAARDAFFNQKTYILRGCEARAMFDGRADTFFDGQSKNYREEDLRIDNGCLRIDLGKTYPVERIELECFAVAPGTIREISPFAGVGDALTGCDYTLDGGAIFTGFETLCDNYKQEVVKFTVHDITEVTGRRLKLTWMADKPFRFFALPCPPDRIFSVRFFGDKGEIKPENIRANNMQGAFFSCERSLVAELTLPDNTAGKKIAVGLDSGESDDRWCVLEADGEYYGFNDRAPSFRSNMWEHRVTWSNGPVTTFFDLDESFAGKTVRIYALLGDKARDCKAEIYLCDRHN